MVVVTVTVMILMILLGFPGANIFVFHVPINWTDDDFNAHFSPLLRSIHEMRSLPRRRAFPHMKSRRTRRVKHASNHSIAMSVFGECARGCCLGLGILNLRRHGAWIAVLVLNPQLNL